MVVQVKRYVRNKTRVLDPFAVPKVGDSVKIASSSFLRKDLNNPIGIDPKKIFTVIEIKKKLLKTWESDEFEVNVATIKDSNGKLFNVKREDLWVYE